MSTVVAFDTLKFVRRLRDAGVEEKQAEAFSEAFREVQDSQLKDLVTKGDLRELKLELKSDIRDLELRMDDKFEKELSPVRSDLLLIKWMLALIITATVLPALKAWIG
ncbi:MAG: DUF1640 domain-containing protein [Magnetococcales bacterium]|nr:DUF1640 domain-containing protein [Magnetococcales bacterium]